MLEPRRSQYLRALGIDVYVSRFILPGAAASQPAVWEDIDSAADAVVAMQANSVVVNSPELNPIESVVGEVAATLRQRSLPAHLDFEITPTARRTNNADQQRSVGDGRVAESQTNAAAAPKFALSVAVSAGILVVDDAPANNAARGEYLRLLGNVLAALRVQAAQPQLDVFMWPAVKHPQLDQGAEAARETLAAYLQKQIQQHAIDTVLVLGAAAQQWCEGISGDNLRCATSVSALMCLREPQHKRQLWQDIRHLAAAH